MAAKCYQPPQSIMFFRILGGIDGASSCKGKQRYSELSAMRAATKMAQKKREPFEHYKCRHCEFWHIGHPRFWNWTAEQKKQAGKG